MMIYNYEKMAFNILTTAKFDHKDGFFSVKGRPYAALSLRTCGTGIFDIDGKSFTSAPGDVLFIPAYKDYKVSYADNSSSTVVHLTDCGYLYPENITACNFAALNLCFDELLKSNGKFNIQKSLIYKILDILERSQKVHMSDIQIGTAFIEQNFCSSQISITDICKAAHISESTLRRRFQACYGISCKQYITNLRLNKAVELLIRGDFSIKQISYQCGFNDEKYFSRLVKKKYGIAPSAFRP